MRTGKKWAAVVLTLALSVGFLASFAQAVEPVTVTVEPVYDAYGESPCANGLIAVQKNKKWGFIDKYGHVVVPCVFDEVGGFFDAADAEGEVLGAVKKGKKWGLINKNGRLVVPFEYDQFWRFSDGLATVVKDRKVGYINTAGELAIPLQFKTGNDFYSGFARVEDDNGWHVINKTGAIVGDFKYNEAWDFRNGLAGVQPERKGKWGFMDPTGALVIPAVYEDFSPFNDTITWVKKDGKWGLIDQTGKELTDFEFDMAYWFLDGDQNLYAQVQKDGKWGYMGRDGKIALPLEYDALNMQFHDGVFAVCKDGKWGYVDESGQTVIPFKYDGAGVFINGMAFFRVGDMRGIMDKNESILIPAEYQAASLASPNVVRAQKEGKWGLLDYAGNILLPLEYDALNIYPDPIAPSAIASHIDVFFLQKGKKWGVAVFGAESPAADGAQQVIGMITVTSSGNVRSNPGTGDGSKVLGKVNRKDTFEVLAWDTVNDWYQFVWEDGQTAWIASKMVEFNLLPQ